MIGILSFIETVQKLSLSVFLIIATCSKSCRPFWNSNKSSLSRSDDRKQCYRENSTVQYFYCIESRAQMCASGDLRCSHSKPLFRCFSLTEDIKCWQVCDGTRDCSDGSDENNCPEVISNADPFECKSGKTTPSRADVCKGVPFCAGMLEPNEDTIKVVSIHTKNILCSQNLNKRYR